MQPHADYCVQLVSKRREKGWKKAAQIPKGVVAPTEGMVTQTRMLQKRFIVDRI